MFLTQSCHYPSAPGCHGRLRRKTCYPHSRYRSPQLRSRPMKRTAPDPLQRIYSHSIPSRPIDNSYLTRETSVCPSGRENRIHIILLITSVFLKKIGVEILASYHAEMYI